jgi:predicted Zn-dependent protease
MIFARRSLSTIKVVASLLMVIFLFVGPQAPEAFALSVEDEEKLGREFLLKVKEYFEICEDGYVNQFINDLGRYLTKPLETIYFPFKFYVINDNSLNAFAAPGGHIFIFSGLIVAVDDVDQLAAVICHEIGHVSARHLSKRIEQQTKINIATMAGILAGIFLGGKAGAALATGSLAAAAQAQLHYSREDERQADQLGYKYMIDSGFRPGALIDALAKIEKGSWLGTDKVPAYLLTHPKGPKRMSNLESLLTDSEGPRKKPEAEHFKKAFPFFKVIVRAESTDPDKAERLFELEREKDPSGTLPEFGLGLVYKKRSEYKKAIQHLIRARNASPESIPILTNLGEAYLMDGQLGLAVEVLNEALDMAPANKAALFVLGLCYEKMENNVMSSEIFERLASFPPVEDQVYYHLGLSYGRRAMLGLAHYNFGLYFKKLGQLEKAKFHFNKAKENAGNDPGLKEKIGKEMKRGR